MEQEGQERDFAAVILDWVNAGVATRILEIRGQGVAARFVTPMWIQLLQPAVWKDRQKKAAPQRGF